MSTLTHLLNTVKLMVFNVFMFHENVQFLTSGESYDLSTGNNEPTDGLTIVFLGIPISNQLVWLQVDKED